MKRRKKRVKEEMIEATPQVIASAEGIPTIEMPIVPEGKTIVNEDALKALLARMDKLEEENKSLKIQSEALADKAKLQRFRAKTAPKMGTIVRLNVWNGKVITGWDSLNKNLCEKTPTGLWKEELERTLHLEDGTVVTLPYIESIRHIEYLDANIKGRQETDEVIDNDGNMQVLLTVEDEKGRPWVIDERFIN